MNRWYCISCRKTQAEGHDPMCNLMFMNPSDVFTYPAFILREGETLEGRIEELEDLIRELRGRMVWLGETQWVKTIDATMGEDDGQK